MLANNKNKKKGNGKLYVLRRGRPAIDDLPLARAIVVLERTGADPRTVRHLAARWLQKQRGISLHSARARVVAILNQPCIGNGDAFRNASNRIHFGFVLAMVAQLYGKATARRLRDNGARACCQGFGFSSDDQLCMFLLAGEIEKARKLPSVRSLRLAVEKAI
jgi:hypothetical protein